MLSATCHCGAVTVEIPRRPRRMTNCNCSICRRYGVLWSYYKDAAVTLTAAPGATDDYSWGDKRLRFIRCATCGCVMQWRLVNASPASRTGVNMRNFDPAVVGPARIRFLDGAGTWKYVG